MSLLVDQCNELGYLARTWPEEMTAGDKEEIEEMMWRGRTAAEPVGLFGAKYPGLDGQAFRPLATMWQLVREEMRWWVADWGRAATSTAGLLGWGPGWAKTNRAEP